MAQYYIDRTDQTALRQLDLEHIYSGEVNAGKATGYHREASGIDDVGNTTARITQYTMPPNAHGVYTGQVEVQTSDGTWTSKISNQGQLTFVPKDWSQARTDYEISEAFRSNPGAAAKGKKFLAASPSGVIFQFVPPTQSAPYWRAWPKQ